MTTPRIPSPEWLEPDEWVVELHPNGAIVYLPDDAPEWRYEAITRPGLAFEIGERHTHLCTTLREARAILREAEGCPAPCDGCGSV
jgi:hypothetical protein